MLSLIRIKSHCSFIRTITMDVTQGIKPKKIKKDKSTRLISQAFVDNKVIKIKAGKGGDGMMSFMHVHGNEWAGPDGGDGGNGGHVILKADQNLKSLNKLKSLNSAESGGNGRSFHMRGKNAEHFIIKVPIGTCVHDTSGNFLADMEKHEQRYVAVHGGAGGKGNYYFLSNVNKEPMEYEMGHEGEEAELKLELKVVSDAALIGYPNVGKSSLLNVLTRSNTKIGDYAFTTLHPHVGIVEYEDFLQISVADLPGLLADPTRGLGTGFLRHLERCRIVLLVIDLSVDNPYQQYKDIENILNFYDKNILEKKPLIIIGNKIDKENSKENLNEFKMKVDRPVIPMSTVEKINITKFLMYLRDVYNKIEK